MLQKLYIRNFAIIDNLDIDFYQGFSVITGETGAGKSIILGAIGALLGNKVDSKIVKAGETKCTIEAHFNLSRYNLKSFFDDNDIDYDEDDCILRREINANGKSRAFINDTPTTLNIIKELGEQLIDIHSQHQNLLLKKEDFQLNVVDIIAQDQKDDKLLQNYKQTFADYRAAEKNLAALQQRAQQSKDEEDLLRFQFNELETAALSDETEQETLEQTLSTLSHVEEIKSALFAADQSFADENGILSQLKAVADQIQRTSDIDAALTDVAERLQSNYIDLKDISRDINSHLEEVDFDPQRTAEIEQRLDLIYGLEKKYSCDGIPQLIEKRDTLKVRLNEIDNSDETIAELQQQVEKLHESCENLSEKLTQKRQKAAKKVELEVQSKLAKLGIPKVRFQVSFDKKPLAADGADKIAFLFSANAGSPLLPISQVASGGEIARVMLCLKALISGAVKLPTIIFDEIDTGVSGRVAEQMALIMHEMAENGRQVISITHLPQIAAVGEHHYRVSKSENKDTTTTKMEKLSTNQRIDEIAQMLSGSNVTDAAIENAKNLLGL